MNGMNCEGVSVAKKESPIEQELKHLLDNISSLREEHGRLYQALVPALRQLEPQAAGPSPTKGEPDNSSPIMCSLKTLSGEIVAETRAVAEMTERLEL